METVNIQAFDGDNWESEMAKNPANIRDMSK